MRRDDPSDLMETEEKSGLSGKGVPVTATVLPAGGKKVFPSVPLGSGSSTSSGIRGTPPLPDPGKNPPSPKPRAPSNVIDLSDSGNTPSYRPPPVEKIVPLEDNVHSTLDKIVTSRGKGFTRIAITKIIRSEEFKKYSSEMALLDELDSSRRNWNTVKGDVFGVLDNLPQ